MKRRSGIYQKTKLRYDHLFSLYIDKGVDGLFSIVKRLGFDISLSEIKYPRADDLECQNTFSNSLGRLKGKFFKCYINAIEPNSIVCEQWWPPTYTKPNKNRLMRRLRNNLR